MADILHAVDNVRRNAQQGWPLAAKDELIQHVACRTARANALESDAEPALGEGKPIVLPTMVDSGAHRTPEP
jgi:hypothetical protein